MNSKRLMAGLLCLCMVFALCACGQKTPDPTDPTKTTDTTDATEATDATDATEATDGKEVVGADLDFAADGRVILYDALLQSENEDFFYAKDKMEFDDFGLVVDSKKVLKKYYSISDRTVHYVCRFGADTTAMFKTVIKTSETSYNDDTTIFLFVADKKIGTRLGYYEVPFLNGTDPFLVSISKLYQQIIMEVTNLTTGEHIAHTLQQYGSGDYKEMYVAGMQYDYYALELLSGAPYSVSRMTVTCADADLLIYGDSITEPEAYWPAETFDQSWVQQMITNFTGGKAVSSGRCGDTIVGVLERIKNELPYIKPKYCMITIGTNGGDTVENLTELVRYIKSQGVTPILNRIPCSDKAGDKTSFLEVNQIINIVRQNEGVTGCDFDLATSLAGDGKEVDINTMWAAWSGDKVYYHHPNNEGSAKMIQQMQKDLPELFQ